MDVLQLAHREPGDPPTLVSAGCGVSIQGPEDSLRRLNALLVPAPTFLEVDFKTYISLAPVLRCRWRGQDSKGPWVVRFSMADIEGFKNNNFSKYVSVFRRPTASPGDKWELLDRVDDVDEASDEEETVSVVVSHFSDLIATIDNATASEKCKGYIIKPRKLQLIKVTPFENVALGSVTRLNDQIGPLLRLTYLNIGLFLFELKPHRGRSLSSLPTGSQDGARAQRISGRAEVLSVLALHHTHRGKRRGGSGGSFRVGCGAMGAA